MEDACLTSVKSHDFGPQNSRRETCAPFSILLPSEFPQQLEPAMDEEELWREFHEARRKLVGSERALDGHSTQLQSMEKELVLREEEEEELKLDELWREFNEARGKLVGSERALDGNSKLQSMEEELVLREEQFNAIQAFLPKHVDIDGRVKLNVGGKRLEINRATIHTIFADPDVVGEYYLSAVRVFASLLTGRWDRFLPRDRAGCIYLDFELAWILPFVDAITAISKGIIQPMVIPELPQDIIGFKNVMQLITKRKLSLL